MNNHSKFGHFPKKPYKRRTPQYSIRKSEKRAAAGMIPLIIALLLVLVVGVGGTLAYLFTHTDPIKNEFNPGDVDLTVAETFDEPHEVKKNVSIQNTGEVDAYIRVAVVVTWVNDDGESVFNSKNPVQGTDYEITYGESTYWVQGADDFWYYTKPVAAGDFTDVLIKECKPIEGKAPDGFTLSVEIVASSIQATPEEAVESSWSNAFVTVQVGEDKNLTVTAKEAGEA